MPPRLMRTNLRSRARAMLRPSDVLPTPGGPTKHRIGVCSVRLLGAVGSAAGPVGAGTTGSEGDSGPGGDAGAGGDAGGSADPWLGAEMVVPRTDDDVESDPASERRGVPASTGPALSDSAFSRIRSRTASHSSTRSFTFERP